MFNWKGGKDKFFIYLTGTIFLMVAALTVYESFFVRSGNNSWVVALLSWVGALLFGGAPQVFIFISYCIIGSFSENAKILIISAGVLYLLAITFACLAAISKANGGSVGEGMAIIIFVSCVYMAVLDALIISYLILIRLGRRILNSPQEPKE